MFRFDAELKEKIRCNAIAWKSWRCTVGRQTKSTVAHGTDSYNMVQQPRPRDVGGPAACTLDL